MNRAKNKKANTLGLSGLLIAQKKAKADANKILASVFNGRATPDAIDGLVYEQSLIELICIATNIGRSSAAVNNAMKGVDKRTAKKLNDMKAVFQWCDANPADARGLPFKALIDLVASATKIKETTTVRGFISLWRKQNHN